MKKIVIVPTILFILFFNVSLLLAVNIGRNVYGLKTETYNGVIYDQTVSTPDGVHMIGSGYDNTDRVEGSLSTSVGDQWWFGIHFDSNQDMSSYSGGKLYFSAMVPVTISTTNAGNAIRIKDSAGEKSVSFGSDLIQEINSLGVVISTGMKSDNTWHTYYIELANFTGLNLSSIEYPFMVDNTTNNNTLLFDNVYLKKNTAGTFNVTVKNISDNLETSSVTWSTSSFRQNWVAAEQYIELDLDLASPVWSFKIYTNNGSADKDGLVDTSNETSVLQMCWRVSKNLLPNSDGDTLLITKSGYPNYALYDSGKFDSDHAYYSWFYIKDKSSEDTGDYVVIWDSRGFQAATGGAFWGMSGEIYPKIYLGANFANALGGLNYDADIVIEFNYE